MHQSLTSRSVKNVEIIRFSLSFFAAAGLASFAHAGEVKANPLSELSLTLKESYDSNVFGTERNPTLAGLPEIADVASWVTTISPKVGLNLKSALDLAPDSPITALSLGYTGDYAFFHSASTETNQRHNLSQQLKSSSNDVSVSFDNSFIYVDGKEAAPQYNLYSCYGSASARERREQFQDRAKFVLRYDSATWFLRAVSTALIYDLKTVQHQAVASYTGWQNYVDRSDLNGGFDLGYKATKDLSLWAGYRYGEQKQSQLPWDLRHNDSNYHRTLIGAEGKLAQWLKLDLQVGPDFRTYRDADHLGLNGKTHTWLYTEGSISADLSKDDTLVFTNKVWHWVSSTGIATYQDSTYALNYTHKFSAVFSGTAGVRVLGSNYDLPTTRKDWLDTYSVGLRYTFSKHVAVTGDYAYTHTRNQLSDTLYPGREYSQNVFSLGVRLTY